MSKIDTGGPAFPCDLTAYDPEVPREMQGMTLRDYFAAKAMLGELAAQSERAGFYENLDALAVLSYRIADALLKERNKSE